MTHPTDEFKYRIKMYLLKQKYPAYTSIVNYIAFRCHEDEIDDTKAWDNYFQDYIMEAKGE